jgi:threonine dehydrogenase-like Zn-dependent dehydrogenase
MVSSYTSVRNSIQAVRLLESGRINIDNLVSHKLSLEGFKQGVEAIEHGRENAMKILIIPSME